MSRPVRFLLYKPIVALCDVLVMNAGFLLAFYVLWFHLATKPKNFLAYQHLALLISITSILAFHLLDLYRDWLRRSLRHVVYSITIAVVLIQLTTMALGFWNREFAFPRSVLAVAGILQIGLVAMYRLQMRRLYRRWLGNRRTVVIGQSSNAALAVADKFQKQTGGIYAVERHMTRRQLAPPYRELEDAETVVFAQDVADKDDVILFCFRSGKEVLVIPSLSELTVFGAETREVDDLLVFGIQPHRLNPAEELIKRIIDLSGSMVLLILASPFLLTAAALIRMTSKGSILFRQERVGVNGKLFDILKFRTMIADAEQQSGPVLASHDDPRITPLGRFLRATRIDELPQLFNVLRGEMSLVGPRPERAFFVRQYERKFPAYELRHSVKPGLTGLAQVVGRYSTTVERKLHFDLLYIYNFSLLLDLKILFQTIPVVLQGEQAEGLHRGAAVTHFDKYRTGAVADVESAVQPMSSSND